MEKILLSTPASQSEIFVGLEWESVATMIPANNSVIVTDSNVKRLYGDRFPDIPILIVPPGENSKKLEMVEELAVQLLNEGVDRSGFILAIGGGVVCDLAGFLASVYMRGIRCAYVSSTLLAQVDASTGGKNGVNLGVTKNILGVIRQPDFVICDPAMLITLPEDEYLSGLAELIKTAIIGDRELFDLIADNASRILARDIDLMSDLVTRSVRFKASIVTADEREAGIRKILNFGHTFGHVIELQMGVKHGFAVAAGMELATCYSYEKGLINRNDLKSIINLLEEFRLSEQHYISDKIIEEIILHDKKKTGSEIHFVFVEGIGKAVYNKVPVAEILDFYKRFRDKKIVL